MPQGLIIKRSVTKALTNLGTGKDMGTVTATVPSGYTFLCWTGAEDPTYYAVIGFKQPNNPTSHIQLAATGGNTGNRTFTFYYLCILSSVA